MNIDAAVEEILSKPDIVIDLTKKPTHKSAVQKEYNTAKDVLRILHDKFKERPSSSTIRHLITTLVNVFPERPGCSEALMKLIGSRKYFTRLNDAIQNYNNAYVTVKVDDIYVVCANKDDLYEFIEDLSIATPQSTGVLANEVVLSKAIHNLSFITHKKSTEELRQLKQTLVDYFGTDEIEVFPCTKDRTKNLFILRKVCSTHAGNVGALDEFINANNEARDNFRMPDQLASPIDGITYMLIPITSEKYTKSFTVKDATKRYPSTRDSNSNPLVNNQNIIGGDHMTIGTLIINQNITMTESKSFDDAAFTKWLDTAPTNLLAKDLHVKFISDNSYPMSYAEFCSKMLIAGYKRKKTNQGTKWTK
jgi:hypothetical protein